jgi:hypothetical protein
MAPELLLWSAAASLCIAVEATAPNMLTVLLFWSGVVSLHTAVEAAAMILDSVLLTAASTAVSL